MRLLLASRPRTRSPRRLVAGSLVTLLAAASVCLTADPAEAYVDRPETSAPEIGELADRALHSLDAARASRNLARMGQYHAERDLVAIVSAGALGLDHEAMRAAWAAADTPHQEALLAAISQLGVPYRSMASEENVGFDCSGLTSYAWAEAGIGLSRSSGSQISEAAARSHDEAMAGDLVQYPGHVMMYLGVDDAIVHSPYSGKSVELTFVRADRSVSFGNPLG